jgi:hypothetical protein
VIRRAALPLLLLALGLSACRGEGPAPVVRGPEHPRVFRGLPDRPVRQDLEVQLAYNLDDGVLYGRLSWEAPREQVGPFWRFEDGAWVLRGADAREAASADDPVRAESRVSVAWSPATGAAAMPNFALYGCMTACHDDGSRMPDWTEDGAELLQTMRLPQTPHYAGRGFDLWTWGAQTGAALGQWSDGLLDDTAPGAGEARRADPGTGGATDNALAGGNPSFVLDPAGSAGGGFATTLTRMDAGEDFALLDPANPSATAPPGGTPALAWADAVAAGYAPQEGDAVPALLLAARDGGRGDVLDLLSPDGGLSIGPRSGYDAATGRWVVHFSRSLGTATPGADVSFAVGAQYLAAFAVHGDGTAQRDHRVSMPLRIWLEDPANPFGGAGSELTARQLLGAGLLPDFDDTGFHAPATVELFLPGVLSWEYHTDTRSAAFAFGQRHGGADDLQSALNGPGFTACLDCHVVDAGDPDAPFVVGGAIELRTPRRGGLFEATPISLRSNVLPSLAARCGGCHEAGGTASSMPLANADAEIIRRELLEPGRVEWQHPAASRVLRVPSEDLDGNHPPLGALAGFAGSPDARRLLFWLQYNAPDN